MSDMHYRLAITPLSPVHMGTDADYEPTNYVIDDGALYEFDAIAAMQALPDSERRQLNRILADRPNDVLLRGVQSFFYANRERLIAFSRRQVRVNPSVEAFYKERVGRVAQHERSGRRVQNKLEIERAAWNPVSGQPIMPGSGLKGAMRTALLDGVNKGSPLRKATDRKTGRPRDEKNMELQNRLFRYRAGKFELDPMRLIRLGDAVLRDGMQLPTEVMFALNRKKRPVQKDGVFMQSQAEQQGLYQLLECLPPFFDRPFEGSLSIQNLEKVGDERNTPTLRFSADDISRACNRFYQPILRRELDLLRRRGLVDQNWAERMESLLQQLQPAFEGGKAFLLRVGRHSGAESVTLNGVRSIRIMKGRGESPNWSDSPKTVWLAGHERQAQSGLLPFGWLLVEFAPQGPSLFDGIKEQNNALASWQRKVKARIDERREAAERERVEWEVKRRREQEAAARHAAELAEQRAREDARRKAREAALQQMDPVQREVEEFDTVLDAIHALESNHWGDKQREAARYVRERMQSEGIWVEQSKKKRPEKDKPYQRTLLVLKYLE